MQAELTRTQTKLKSQPVPPYYLSYEITETHSIGISGAFGKIESSGESRNRRLGIDLRVGDYGLDNTREVRGEMNGCGFHAGQIPRDLLQQAVNILPVRGRRHGKDGD
jgi:hypothetical protein